MTHGQSCWSLERHSNGVICPIKPPSHLPVCLSVCATAQNHRFISPRVAPAQESSKIVLGRLLPLLNIHLPFAIVKWIAAHFWRACVSVRSWVEKELPTRETREADFEATADHM